MAPLAWLLYSKFLLTEPRLHRSQLWCRGYVTNGHPALPFRAAPWDLVVVLRTSEEILTPYHLLTLYNVVLPTARALGRFTKVSDRLNRPVYAEARSMAAFNRLGRNLRPASSQI